MSNESQKSNKNDCCINTVSKLTLGNLFFIFKSNTWIYSLFYINLEGLNCYSTNKFGTFLQQISKNAEYKFGI